MKKRNRKKEQAVSPETWLQRILALPEQAQQQVARVVWWDHFAGRLVMNRWTHMDHWLLSPEKERLEPIDRDTFVKYLIEIGYEEEKAILRIR
jgi:hypothetical protein